MNTLLRHIKNCNAWNPRDFLPLLHDGARLGYVRRDNAEKLKQFSGLFAVDAGAVKLLAKGDRKSVTAQLNEATETLVKQGAIAKWRHEYFTVAEHWGAEPRFDLDRGVVPFFGVRAYGVHLNGWRRDRGKLELWVGRRAPDKLVAPNQLDNLVAGGIGGGHGLHATLLKEAEEEAGMAKDLARRAVAAGALSYRMATKQGLRDDVLFVYDIETPADFTPHNTDGEIVDFTLMDATDVVAQVRDTDDFKFNVNLVIIDFALRHGVITADDPDYLAVASGLHRAED